MPSDELARPCADRWERGGSTAYQQCRPLPIRAAANPRCPKVRNRRRRCQVGPGGEHRIESRAEDPIGHDQAQRESARVQHRRRFFQPSPERDRMGVCFADVAGSRVPASLAEFISPVSDALAGSRIPVT